MTLGPDSLVLCAGTLPQAPSLRERCEVASAAGFDAISLFIDDYARAKADGLSDPDIRAVLSDCGLAVGEVDPLMNWVPAAGPATDTTEQGRGFLRHSESDFFEACEAVGARSINLVSITDTPPPTDALAAAFAGVCDRAAERGLLVHLEFLPWTHIPDLGAALTIVGMANRPNGGVMLDSWHHYRSGGSGGSLLGTTGDRILGVQINDAPAMAEENLVAETTQRRLLPGEGETDLADVIRALDSIGSRAPIGVEVFSTALAERPAAEVAQRAADAARAVLAEARGR